MKSVFLSYTRQDKEKVAWLASSLRTADFDVWWDDDIPPGAAWEATIEQALAAASTVIVCWSPAAALSDNVRSEARWGKGHRRLVQVFLDKCDPPLFFGEHQGLDLSSWQGNREDHAFRRLTTALADVGDASASTAPIPFVARRPKNSMWWWVIGSAAALMAVAAVAIFGWWKAGSAESEEQLVLIQPLRVLGGDSAAGTLRRSLSSDLAA